MQNLNQELEQELSKTFQEFLNSKHQAFILRSSYREIVFAYFKENLESEFKHKENFFLNLQVLDIHKVREIINYLKNNFSGEHFVVLSFYSINENAQNAFLKSLEEIIGQVKIILIVNGEINLLDTVLSRLYNLTFDNNLNNIFKKEEAFKNLAVDFLKNKKLKRLNTLEIKELLNKKDSYAEAQENKERMDREYFEKFLLEIHNILFTKLERLVQENKDLEEIQKYNEYLEDILESIKYIKLSSSSAKNILEYLALKLPEF